MNVSDFASITRRYWNSWSNISFSNPEYSSCHRPLVSPNLSYAACGCTGCIFCTTATAFSISLISNSALKQCNQNISFQSGHLSDRRTLLSCRLGIREDSKCSTLYEYLSSRYRLLEYFRKLLGCFVKRSVLQFT